MAGIRNPVLGITTYREQARSGIWDVPAGFLPSGYFDGVAAAGGVAVLLPPQPGSTAIVEAMLDRLDGLVLTGGADVDPARYGQPAHPATDPPDRDRDAWELGLLSAALRRGLPVLGICRGAQLLNVALGGTLHQHLPDLLGQHRHRVGDAVFATSTAHTVPGTRLAALLGAAADVPCHHHQAIAELGAGLVVSARTDDGVIEAVELPGASFVVAVQWHPEEALADPRLFTAVVAAARDYATNR